MVSAAPESHPDLLSAFLRHRLLQIRANPPRKPADEPTGRSDVTTDTILVLQDGQVACDFLVLALISPNWLARFPSEDLAWSASDTPRVLILPDVTLADMETLLELLYVGQTLPLPLDRIHALKRLTQMLQCRPLSVSKIAAHPLSDGSATPPDWPEKPAISSEHYIFNNECQMEAPPSSPETSVRISYIDEAEVDVEEDSHQGGLLTIVSSPKPSPKHRRPTRIHVGAVPISKVPPDTYVHWTNCFQGAQRFAHKPCPVCNQIFLGLHPLIAHLKAQHANQGQNNRLVTCHICQTQCDSGLDLHHHLRMHFKSDHSLSKTVSNRQYLCLVEDCNYVSQSVRNHKAHMANVHQRKPFQCHQCGDEFVSKANLKVHESSRHSPLDQKSSFQCVKCDRHFKRKSSLTSHVIDQHQLKPEDRTLSCPICKIDLKGRRNLLKHQKVHQSQEKQFQCSFCPKLFLKHNGLVVHERIHTGEMPFECEICGVKFKRSHHLNFHLKSNSHAANVKDAQRTQNQSDQGQGAEPDVKSIT